ncbi:exported hypothetical protein [uncultured Alphaproteobacteria bacterium]|uniref:Uncharacterized protein n=1 Tax=uncultured Alphaproteobacteria bacterium TaxID=91750 RepID=A0A212J2S3_9PROT|nr:exported hypothetical protein [uncultured Alphaproteobacteria bacterium]
MRRATCLAFALILGAVPAAANGADLVVGSCAVDDQVPAEERASYQRAAIAFVDALARGDAADLRAAAFPEMWQGMSDAEIRASAGTTAETYGNFAAPHVVHSYRVVIRRFGEGETGFYPCAASARSGLKSEKDRVIVAVRNVPVQAHVVIEASANDVVWTFTLWLMPGEERWQVSHMHVSAGGMGGMRPDRILSLARRERDAGRGLNARLLYSAAAGSSYRGPYLIPSDYRIAVAEMQAIPMAAPFDAPPPWRIETAASSAAILAMKPVLFPAVRKIYLEITLDAQGLDDEAAEHANRALISAFKTAHPEYAAAFDGIVASARIDDRKHWRTVDPAAP